MTKLPLLSGLKLIKILRKMGFIKPDKEEVMCFYIIRMGEPQSSPFTREKT